MNENKETITLWDCIDAARIREIKIDQSEREHKARVLAEQADNTRRILVRDIGLQPDRIEGRVATFTHEGKEVRLHVWEHKDGSYRTDYGILLEVGVCPVCGEPTFTEETFSRTAESIGYLLLDPHPRKHNHEDDIALPRRRNWLVRFFRYVKEGIGV